MKKNILIWSFSFVLLFFNFNIFAADHDTFLAKPTGTYGVGYQDFHWIDTNRCPDVNYIGNNYAFIKDDYSPENTKYCHEIVARIYYPTNLPAQQVSPYYYPILKSYVDSFSQDNGIFSSMLKQVSETKSFSEEKAPIVPEKSFPVILFSPGSTTPTEIYENSIANLVSNGYIVVAVSTPFAHLVTLPNGHTVVPMVSSEDFDTYTKQQFPIIKQDLLFVYNQIRQPSTDKIFLAMDTKNIGAFGHSIGASAIAELSYANPNLFQAAVFFDLHLGHDPGTITKAFALPYMFQLTAQFAYYYSPLTYELVKNGYLVEIYPNHDPGTLYSTHGNYEDLSTLQYFPAAQLFLKHTKGDSGLGVGDGFEIANSVNIYTVKFFDMYLKGRVDPKFGACQILSNNTSLNCGSKKTNNVATN